MDWDINRRIHIDVNQLSWIYRYELADIEW